MILSSETTPGDAQQMLEFYKQHFAVVEVVSCGKCDAFLAIECSGGDGMGLQPNELGKYVISFGDNLLSHRVRLDEAPTGERMVGYQCGAPVPNPAYAFYVRDHDKEVAEYEEQYKKDVALYEADQAKLKKNKDHKQVYSEPLYSPPEFNGPPETIECGNDTRIADVERGHVPVGAMQTSLSPFEKHQIREKINSVKAPKRDFKKVGNIKHFETFQVERIE
jgi:hypothetical protein